MKVHGEVQGEDGSDRQTQSRQRHRVLDITRILVKPTSQEDGDENAGQKGDDGLEARKTSRSLVDVHGMLGVLGSGVDVETDVCGQSQVVEADFVLDELTRRNHG